MHFYSLRTSAIFRFFSTEAFADLNSKSTFKTYSFSCTCIKYSTTVTLFNTYKSPLVTSSGWVTLVNSRIVSHDTSLEMTQPIGCVWIYFVFNMSVKMTSKCGLSCELKQNKNSKKSVWLC